MVLNTYGVRLAPDWPFSWAVDENGRTPKSTDGAFGGIVLRIRVKGAVVWMRGSRVQTCVALFCSVCATIEEG